MEHTKSGSQSRREHLAKGDVVVVPHDQVNNKDVKNRPYLILRQAGADSYTICLITSRPSSDHRIAIKSKDFRVGTLTHDPSYARPDILHTIDWEDSWYKVGSLKDDKVIEVIEKAKSLLDQPRIEAPILKALERPPIK